MRPDFYAPACSTTKTVVKAPRKRSGRPRPGSADDVLRRLSHYRMLKARCELRIPVLEAELKLLRELEGWIDGEE